MHYVRDALGSVVGLLDAGEPDATPEPVPAKLVERYDYDPYGKTYIAHWDPAAGSGSGDWVRHEPDEPSAYGNPFMWTGQRHDVAIGLYHFPFRTYSPRLGRWLQRDPLGYVDGVNMYEYVASRPLSMVDAFALSAATGAVPATVAAHVAGMVAASTAALLAAIQTNDIGRIDLAITAFEHQLRDALDLLSGFTLTESLAATMLQANATLAAAKTYLEMLIAMSKQTKKSGKDRSDDLPTWAKGNSVASNLGAYARKYCQGKTPRKCVEEFFESLGIKQPARDLFKKILKHLERTRDEWDKTYRAGLDGYLDLPGPCPREDVFAGR